MYDAFELYGIFTILTSVNFIVPDNMKLYGFFL